MSRSSNNDAVAAGAVTDVVGFLLFLFTLVGDARAVGAVVATARTTTVELDALALAGDAVALAGARAAAGVGGAVAGHGRVGGRAVGAVGERRTDRGDGRSAEVGDDVLVVEAGAAEAGSEFSELLVAAVVRVEDVLGGVGRHGLGGLDLRDGQGTALGDVNMQGSTAAAGRLVLLGGRRRLLGRGLGGRLVVLGRGGRLLGRGLLLGGGDVEDVELAASGGLGGGIDTGVVGDVVTVDDVVVPVSLTGLEATGLEAEGSLPRARLGGRLVLGKRELTDVTVPRAEKVNGLDARRDAEGERELDGGHFEL